MIELLAPAKDKKCAIAAIDYGADAIYIGASEFGARRNAPNSLTDIQEIVEYAHKFNVKVYITINTILDENEILKAKDLILNLEKIGVDAIIVQDMGLFQVLNDSCSIPLHASTQCDNRTPEKIKFLENVGFSRVVLARELSIEQIKKISANTNVELEAFIHGALCVSYSGQCYLSQMIGGRSANRGECAQPCRKKYSLVDEEGNFISKDKYLLCLKDFNASKHIKELVDAGVMSFKIEGRLKDENYVKNVVGYYRKLIDNLGYKKTSSGQILFDFEPNVEKSFNRGFTDYFLDGRRKKCFTFDSPKSIGEYLGKVSFVGKDYFEIRYDEKKEISSQDGLCFINNCELLGCLVNKFENNKIYPNKMPDIKIGAAIYRNFDSEFEKQLKISKTCRKIDAKIEFDLGEIRIIDEDGTLAIVKYEIDEFAQNELKMSENIGKQLRKTGESDFLVSEVKINASKKPFLPVSKLNELRRELLENLMKKRVESYVRECHSQIGSEVCEFTDKEIDYHGNVLNKYAKLFYEKHGAMVKESALEGGKIQNSGKCAMTTKHCLRYSFGICRKDKTSKSISDKLYLIDEKGKRYNLNFNCNKCEMEIIF